MNDHSFLVGACKTADSKITFRVWAPLKKKMTLVLEKTPQAHPLVKDKFGYWTVTLSNIKPDTTYFYKSEDEKLLPDPASRLQPQGVHGPSAVSNDFFAWTDHSWKGLSLQEMIIYELHVGTFTKQGTFDGVISKLLYLKELGVNAIELMPVAQFSGTRNWGYDGAYPFAVQNSYGGIEGLKKLVNEAHRLGIAIILDVVYNHLGPEGNYLSAYGPYFTEKYKTGWGNALNFDDAWCDGVRNFFLQNAMMWLDEFHIDALRLDAVHAIWDSSATHLMQELKTKTAELESRLKSKKILIAEFDLNNPRYINPQSVGGYGLDGQWIDEFHHALHALVTKEKNGYYEDFGDANHLRESLKNSYVYTGQYSTHRKKKFGALPKENPFCQFIVFSQNHDQIGNRLLGDRLASSLTFENLKLVAATVLLSPHIPLLFMGEEYGEKNPFQYFISHIDKDLVDLIREGRKKEFSYFNWQQEIPDPQSESTFEKCKLSWPFEMPAQTNTLFEFYKHLISFRKHRLAMKGTGRDSLKLLQITNDNTIAFERNFQGDTIQVMLNFGKEPVVIPFPNRYKKILDSADRSWDGPGEVSINHDKIFLNSESAIILEP